MTQWVKVNVEIPDGYELACTLMRDVKPSDECWLSPEGRVLTGGLAIGPRVILQRKIDLESAAKRLVALGDKPGVFMTCECGGGAKPCVRLECQDLDHAQEVHRTIIDIFHSVRSLIVEEEE